jgi:hypothetical protein
MTQININKVTSFSTSTPIPMIKTVDFNFLGHKVYSATKTQQIYGVFVSNVVEASSYFLRWHQITWTEQKDNFSDIILYIKSASSEDLLSETHWDGPYYDGEVELSDKMGKYLQFCVVLKKSYSSSVNYPSITDISLKYYTSQTASKFYTRSFKIGFTPKTVVLTYNADVVDDVIVRFAISGVDSPDTTYYQYIEPNKIVQLDSISYLSDSIKVMMELIGTSQSEAVVNEFALMFSGEQAFKLNKVYMESSSSTNSSSSSTSSTSSSSSIDSSSSSSSSSTSNSSSSSTNSSSSSSS